MKKKIVLSVVFVLIVSFLFTSCLTDILAGVVGASVSPVSDVGYSSFSSSSFDDSYYTGSPLKASPRNPKGNVTNLTKSDVDNFIKNHDNIETYLNPSMEKDDNYGKTPTEDGFVKVLNKYGISGDNCALKYEMIIDCYTVLYEEILDQNPEIAQFKGKSNDPMLATRNAIADVKKRTNNTDLEVVRPYRDKLSRTISPNLPNY